MTNALKYAFDYKKEGQVSVGISQLGSSEFCLTVEDDGIGISKDFQLKDASSLGLKMVNGLAQQIEGSFRWERRSPGTCFTINFKNQSSVSN